MAEAKEDIISEEFPTALARVADGKVEEVDATASLAQDVGKAAVPTSDSSPATWMLVAAGASLLLLGAVVFYRWHRR